jgi:hypothetical protein
MMATVLLWPSGPVTSNDSQLTNRAAASVDGLTVTVESVKHIAQSTRVGLAVRNNTGGSLALPLYGYCVFRAQDGTVLEADPFNSQWVDELATGGLQRGTVIFAGHLPNSVRQAALSFTTVFGDSAPESITVPNIMLKQA